MTFCRQPRPVSAFSSSTFKLSNLPTCKRSVNLSPLLSLTSSRSVYDRNALNSNPLNALRTAFFATEGWGSRPSYKVRNQDVDSRVHSSSPLAACLCFQRLTHCSICKPFVLITLQQYPGVVGGRPFSIFRLASSRGGPLPILEFRVSNSRAPAERIQLALGTANGKRRTVNFPTRRGVRW